jgi:ferredoxin-NADP reductase
MRNVEVLRAEDLSPSVKGLTLACADGQPLAFLPGQWVNVRVPVEHAQGAEDADAAEVRPYSIASAPDREHPERFELAVTRVEQGRVSLALHKLRAGSRLEIDGPYGFFTRQDHLEEPALLVGTGTGVGPLRAMIQAELRARGPQGPTLSLLFGCRTQADLLYRAEFEALAREHAHFHFEPSLSRPDDAWTGRRGYVQTQLAELVTRLGHPHVYVCGLSAMVNDVRAVLKQSLGYDRKRIHTERYD